MVLLERESLNSLFETLQEWERQLETFDHDELRGRHEQNSS